MSPKYSITLNQQVLNHLGLNLYSNMPSVISEVVANSWDADAKKVDITIDSDAGTITIFDDGSGMNVDDINNRFLHIGYCKRLEAAQSKEFKRNVMGRKGIGKLSLFSIAQIISVYSNKDGEKNALRIDTDELSRTINDGDVYSPLELNVSGVDFDTNGTKIVLTKLKKRTLNLAKFLKRRLARRFSVIGDEYNFNIFINGEKIVVEDREYLGKAQYLWTFGDHATFINQTNKNVLKYDKNRPNTWEHNGKTYSLSGWIATSEEPNALKDEDETINRIVIIVRGKMAKEDILSEFGETGLYSKYVFGELYVEFLDNDAEDDIATSNRQDFFEDDERYIALKEFVQGELREIKNSWIELRNKIGTEEAQKIEVVKTWYDDLGPDERKVAQKLFGKINQLTVEPSDKHELIRHGILAFETLKLKDSLSEFDNISPEDIEAFIKAANTLNSIEAAFYYKIVYERLAVIKKLTEVIANESTLEKVIQHLLAQNLWLIDPSWDRGTEIPIVEETIKKQFAVINDSLTPAEKDSRFDVRYKKASNRHVVIELKRSGRVVKSLELTEQVRKYHSAMKKVLENAADREPFEIIVLVGRKLDGQDVHPDTYAKTMKSFELYDTRIMHYSELLANAEKMYSDFIAKNREAEDFFERFIITK